ncbi:hypothetical protein VTK56DRAFT_7983 [Thermocarpiscus australiensis]
MISRYKSSNAVSRVAIIDFNLAYVLQHCERARKRMEAWGTRPGGIREGLPVSPIEYQWYANDFTYGGSYSEWIPESWATKDDISIARAVKWLVKQWYGSPEFQPPPKQFLQDLCGYEDIKSRTLLQEIEKSRRVASRQRNDSGADEFTLPRRGGCRMRP